MLKIAAGLMVVGLVACSGGGTSASRTPQASPSSASPNASPTVQARHELCAVVLASGPVIHELVNGSVQDARTKLADLKTRLEADLAALQEQAPALGAAASRLAQAWGAVLKASANASKTGDLGDTGAKANAAARVINALAAAGLRCS